MSDAPNRKIPSEMQFLLDKWARKAGLLRAVHMGLGFLTIAFSVIVAAGISIDLLPSVVIQIFAILSAISVGLLAGFDIGSKANRMMNGWRILNTAKFRFEFEEENFGRKELNDTYKEAEFIIGDVKENVH